MPINNFSPEVCKRIRYYVYRLIDPQNGETFYIGKGSGNRVFHHAAGNVGTELDELGGVENAKLNRINDILAAGLDVIHLIHRHDLSEKEAFHVEGALIDAFPGLTNLQNGVGNASIGVMHADAIERFYAAEEFIPQHNLILLTMRRHFIQERGTYEGCRGVWRMNRERAERAEFVLPVLDGIVIGAFKPNGWLPATVANFPIQIDEDMPSRIGFVGEAAPEVIKAHYVGRRPPPKYLGARIATRYTYE